MTAVAKLDLFHRIVDGPSARVRRFITDHGLEERIRFRNVEFPEAAESLRARGGSGSVPALWDGAALAQGDEACLARLRAVLDIGRDD